MLLSVQSGDVVYDLGFEMGYRLIREAGFEAIDWNIDNGWDHQAATEGRIGESIFTKSPEEVLAYYADELAEIRKNGLVITQAHAPFPSFHKNNPDFLDYAIENIKGSILLCDAVGCKRLVVHGISCRYDTPSMNKERVWELNMKLYSSLIPVLQETDVTVCLENLFTGSIPAVEGTCCDPEEAVALIDTLNEMAGKECFGFCLDTGHLNLFKKFVPTYVHTLGKRIKALHLHDNDSIRDQHLMPFVGCFHWDSFITALRDIGYDGDLNFETFAQILPSRMDEKYVPVFLKAIAGIGEIFRQEIQK